MATDFSDGAMITFLTRADRFIGYAMRTIATSCLTLLFLLLLINVIARTFSFAGFSWFDEIVQGLFAWMVFMGAAALWREKLHFQVDWLKLVLQNTLAGDVLAIIVSLLCLAFMCTMTLYGYDLAVRSRALTPILDLPTSLFYAAIPVSGSLMVIYSLRELFVAFKKIGINNIKEDLK